MHVVRYLKHTLNFGIILSATSYLKLCAYSDADWSTIAYTSRSLSAYCIFMGSHFVSWKTKKQKLVSISLLCNNTTAKHIAQNPVFHERTKHLKRNCHYVREQIEAGFLQIKHIMFLHINSWLIYLLKLLLDYNINTIWLPSLALWTCHISILKGI